MYEGSERWCNVPEPRIPCEDDVSGLGIPDAHQIDGYVCWHQGESGPRTALQTYADSIRAVTLAVHPLSAADCAPPTPAEIDYLWVCIVGRSFSINCLGFIAGKVEATFSVCAMHLILSATS